MLHKRKFNYLISKFIPGLRTHESIVMVLTEMFCLNALKITHLRMYIVTEFLTSVGKIVYLPGTYF